MVNDKILLRQADEVVKYQSDSISSLATALDEMHKTAKDKSDKERKRRVDSFNKKTGTRSVNFTNGDYVLRGLLKRESPKKLNVRWVGPMRITRCLSDFLFETQDLLTGNLKVIHGSRLRFFRNEHFNVTEDVNKFLKFQQGEYASIKSIMDLREQRGNQEVLVSYLGFDEEEPEWVSLHSMHEDVPERLTESLSVFEQGGLMRQRKLARKFLNYLSKLSTSE